MAHVGLTLGMKGRGFFAAGEVFEDPLPCKQPSSSHGPDPRHPKTSYSRAFGFERPHITGSWPVRPLSVLW